MARMAGNGVPRRTRCQPAEAMKVRSAVGAYVSSNSIPRPCSSSGFDGKHVELGLLPAEDVEAGEKAFCRGATP